LDLFRYILYNNTFLEWDSTAHQVSGYLVVGVDPGEAYHPADAIVVDRLVEADHHLAALALVVLRGVLATEAPYFEFLPSLVLFQDLEVVGVAGGLGAQIKNWKKIEKCKC